MKISEAYELYRNDRIVMAGLSKSAYNRYGYHKNLATVFFDNKNISDITLSDIRSYYEYVGRGRRVNTVRCYMNTLKQVFRYARILGIKCLPPELIPVAKEEKVKTTYVTPDDVDRLINATQSSRNKFILSFLFASGMRISEFVSLNRDSIQDGNITIKGKGGKIRLCFIDDRAKKYMNEYLATREDRNAALVLSRQNNRISISAVQLMIRQLNQRAGIQKRITPHTFRHGFCTDLLKNGAPIQDVARLMGHAHVNTTMAYYHNCNEELKKVYLANHTS